MDRLDEIIEFCEEESKYHEKMVSRLKERNLWDENNKLKHPDEFMLGLHSGQETILLHLADMLKRYKDGH